MPEVLDLDRVWITTDGRAKLLDFAAPGRDSKDRTGISRASEPSIFLKQVALSALAGCILEAPGAKGEKVRPPLPLHAAELLDGFDQAGEDLPVERLRAVTKKPPRVPGGLRWGILAACYLPAFFFAAVMTLSIYSDWSTLRRNPRAAELEAALMWDRLLSKAEAEPFRSDAILHIYIAGGFLDEAEDGELWEVIDPFEWEGYRKQYDDIRAKHPKIDPDEFAVASRLVKPSLAEALKEAEKEAEKHEIYWDPVKLETRWRKSTMMLTHAPEWESTHFLFAFVVLLTHGFLGALVAAPSLFSAAVFGQGLLLYLLDLCVVDSRGKRVGRVRLFLRNLILWTAVGLVCLAFGWLFINREILVAPLFLFPLAFYLLFLAERTLPDRLAGTWLVPR